jgi:AmmeMemoRadiSam system protein A
MLSQEDRNTLLKITREAITEYVHHGIIPKREITCEGLAANSGCFVCIKMNGNLRGCIGSFFPDRPLYRLAQEMAVAAATRDPRFYPMRTKDLQEYIIEISILSPLKKIERIDEIEIGIHGIYLEKNSTNAVLLPQVAVEYGWDRETFLAHTCQKGGLPPDAWREGATIQIFSAQVFSDK